MIEKMIEMAREIYNNLGSGFDECVYQKAFEVSLRQAGIKYENQRIIPIYFKGFNIGDSKLDLVVHSTNESVVLELKAIGSSLSAKEETQLKKYMECSNITKGLLINFPQVGRKNNTNEIEVVSIPLDLSPTLSHQNLPL